MLETSFRIHRDEVTRTLINCPPTAERQDSILFATERQLRRNGRWERQRRNGNGRTATEWWKLGITDGDVIEYRWSRRRHLGWHYRYHPAHCQWKRRLLCHLRISQVNSPSVSLSPTSSSEYITNTTTVCTVSWSKLIQTKVDTVLRGLQQNPGRIAFRWGRPAIARGRYS